MARAPKPPDRYAAALRTALARQAAGELRRVLDHPGVRHPPNPCELVENAGEVQIWSVDWHTGARLELVFAFVPDGRGLTAIDRRGNVPIIRKGSRR